jgi:hypothetical protein
MKKSIEFKASLNTEDFDRTVEALQRKLKDIYKGSEQSRTSYQNTQRAGAIGIGPGLSAADRQRMEQTEVKSRRDTDRFIKDQIKDQEELAKRLHRLGLEKERLLRMDKLDIDQKERLARLNTSIASGQNRMAGMNAGVRDALDARGDGSWESQGGWERIMRTRSLRGGIGAAKSMWGGMSFGGKLSAGAGMAGLLGTGLQVGGMLTQDAATRPRETVAAAAGAAQGNALGLQNIAAGKGFQDVFYRAEMKKAIKMADEESSKSRSADKMKALAMVAAIVGGGALIAGTIASAGALPLVLAGAAAMGGGAYGLHKQGAGALGVNIGGRGDKYEAEKEQERAQAFVSNYSSLKELNQIQKVAFEDFAKNAGSDLHLQRQLGLSDEELRKMYKTGTTAGFGRAATGAAAGGVLSAGGSTEAAREMADRANQLARDMDITNSASLIGKLSGTAGGKGSSANADKMLSSLIEMGVKTGLDGSEFREENRRLLENTATIMRAAGASSPESAAAIAASSASYLASKSVMGAESAASAHQKMSEIQKQRTGAGANLEIGTLLASTEFQKATPLDLAFFASLDEDQINSLSPEMLEPFGGEKGRTKLLEGKQAKFLENSQMLNLYSAVRKLKEGGASDEEIKKSPEFNEFVRGISISEKTTPQVAESLGMKRINMPEDIAKNEMVRAAAGKKGGASGSWGEGEDRAADRLARTQAQDEELIMMLRDKMPMAISRTADEFDKTTTKLLKLQEKLDKALREAYKTGDFEAAREAALDLRDIIPQDQGGTPNSTHR